MACDTTTPETQSSCGEVFEIASCVPIQNVANKNIELVHQLGCAEKVDSTQCLNKANVVCTATTVTNATEVNNATTVTTAENVTNIEQVTKNSDVFDYIDTPRGRAIDLAINLTEAGIKEYIEVYDTDGNSVITAANKISSPAERTKTTIKISKSIFNFGIDFSLYDKMIIESKNEDCQVESSIPMMGASFLIFKEDVTAKRLYGRMAYSNNGNQAFINEEIGGGILATDMIGKSYTAANSWLIGGYVSDGSNKRSSFMSNLNNMFTKTIWFDNNFIYIELQNIGDASQTGEEYDVTLSEQLRIYLP